MSNGKQHVEKPSAILRKKDLSALSQLCIPSAPRPLPDVEPDSQVLKFIGVNKVETAVPVFPNKGEVPGGIYEEIGHLTMVMHRDE